MARSTRVGEVGPRQRGSLAEARAYRPRGRTMRERPATPKPAPRTRAEPDTETDPEPRTRSEPKSRARSDPKSRARSEAKSGTRSDPKPRARSEPKSRTGSGSRASRSAKPPPGRRPAGPPRRTAPSKPRTPPALGSPRRRLRLATVLALALFAALGIRLVELQVTEGPAYAADALAGRLQYVDVPAPRGAIYDRNGAVLAHSVEARLVFADPELVANPDRVAAKLQPLLGIPASELARKMRPRAGGDGEPSQYEPLARGVDIAVAKQITALNLPGIGMHYDERRMVPGNDLAANVIGFTGSDLSGLEGMEAQYDEVLRGVDGKRTFEAGRGGTLAQEIPGGYEEETEPQPGSHLHLTLDMDVQYEVQRVLAEKLRAAKAEFGTAVLLDARTGEVLALASYPTYNAADPLASPEADRADVGTSVVFDPGSAHKPFVFGAALEEGVIAAGETVTVDPTIQKGDTTFSDTYWHPPGTELSLAEALGYSSNVGTIMIADELGKDKLYAYQRAFGLGQDTGVGMPAEVAGGLLAPEDWYPSSYGSVPIGHSVDVTAVQMAAAYGAIANDGQWVQPRLVSSVVSPDGAEEATGDPATRRVLSPDTAVQLRELMEAVVTMPGATGTAAAIEGYRVAGKTGTGLLVEDGKYVPGSVSSFVGMAPAEDPRYVLAVSAYVPGGAGAEAVNTTFREAMGFALQHYRVPPSTGQAPEPAQGDTLDLRS